MGTTQQDDAGKYIVGPGWLLLFMSPKPGQRRIVGSLISLVLRSSLMSGLPF